MMQRLGVADIRRVLADCPRDHLTEQLVCQRLGSWNLYVLEDVEDLETLAGQIPVGAWDLYRGDDKGRGSLKDIFGPWKTWLDRPEASDDAEKHRRLLKIVEAGRAFSTRPILYGANRQIHDGKHRLLALYDFWLKGTPPGPIKVFWSDRD